MAATKTTINKLRNAKNVIFWMAQYRKCPFCKKALVEKIGDVLDLTVEHKSGTYDHAKRREKGAHKGVVLAHSSCHKAYTIKKLKVGEKRWLKKKSAKKS